MNSEFIDDFILEYKNQPCLWQGKSEHFKNRKKRQEAYMKLIEVANRHGEHYNIEKTKQKINNLRCAFRVQLKKYTEMKNNKGKEEPYCPKRRYFESLLFLMDEEKPPTTTSTNTTAQVSIPNSPVNPQTAKITDKLKGVTVTKISSSSLGTTQGSINNNSIKKDFPKKGSIIVKPLKTLPSSGDSLETSSNNDDDADLIQVII
uniref:MADF domain-containing protein n=1 Tax=Megaselia scalaris TaxID=36166 RepID=T1GU45_MEGSC